MSTKVVWNIDCTVLLNLLFWQYEDLIVHTICNGVVIIFFMNIGDDFYWLSLRCCCLYLKPGQKDVRLIQ